MVPKPSSKSSPPTNIDHPAQPQSSVSSEQEGAAPSSAIDDSVESVECAMGQPESGDEDEKDADEDEESSRNEADQSFSGGEQIGTPIANQTVEKTGQPEEWAYSDEEELEREIFKHLEDDEESTQSEQSQEASKVAAAARKRGLSALVEEADVAIVEDEQQPKRKRVANEQAEKKSKQSPLFVSGSSPEAQGEEQSHSTYTLPADDPSMTYFTQISPSEHDVLQEEDDNSGTFASRTVFECDECPDLERFRGIMDMDAFQWKHVMEGERKITMDGSFSKKSYTHEGFKMVGGITERMSATEKYMAWRDKVLAKVSRKEQKEARLITLVEHEPCGRTGESARWAAKVAALKPYVQKYAPGTKVTFVVAVNSNPGVASGQYQEWYQAILSLLKDLPGSFNVQIEDESILAANPSVWYPTDTSAAQSQSRSVTDMAHILNIPEDDIEAANLPAMRAQLAQRLQKERQEKCERIDECHAYCRKFIEDINHLRAHGVLP